MRSQKTEVRRRGPWLRLGTVLLIGCCAVTANAREETKRDFRRTVAMPARRPFRIENSNGNIVIRTQSRGEAEISASIRCSANTASEAGQFCDQIRIEVDEGTSLSVHTQYPSNWNSRNLSYSVNYEVAMPETSPLEVRNRFGNVTASNLRAGAVIRNNNGAVTVSGGRGREEIENAFGDVDVRNNEGDLVIHSGNSTVSATDISGTLEISDRFGHVRVARVGRGATIHSNNCEIHVESVTGPVMITNSFGPVVVAQTKSDVTVQNQNGEVRANDVAGTGDLRTSFGNVNFSHVGKGLSVHGQNAAITGDTVGGAATIETTFGQVDLRDVKGGARVTAANSSIRLNGIGGEVFAKTSFDPVTIADVAGPVTVEGTNASVTVDGKSGQRCQPVSVNTTFGSIRVTLPGGQGYNVAARTTFGQIHSELDTTVSGSLGGDSLTGKIAGGGCDLKLTDQNGGIDILKGR